MRLYSKNLLMSRSSEEYEVLNSLKINKQCFFLLDEFQIVEGIKIEMLAHIDKETTGNQPYFWYMGVANDKTAIRVSARHPMNIYRFYICSGYWETLNNHVGTYKKRKVVVEWLPDGYAKTSVLEPDETSVFSVVNPTELVASSYPFCIFGNTSSIATFSGLFYSFKITQNGETIYDIVPAMRTTDGEFGLLNKVDGKFYENQGTGTLERGEENA